MHVLEEEALLLDGTCQYISTSMYTCGECTSFRTNIPRKLSPFNLRVFLLSITKWLRSRAAGGKQSSYPGEYLEMMALFNKASNM